MRAAWFLLPIVAIIGGCTVAIAGMLARARVREAEIRTRRADDWLDTPLPVISDADRQRTNRDIPDTKAGDYFRTVYDLMMLAFQTDVTRVATFSLGGEGQAIAIPEIGITESRHQLSHQWRSINSRLGIQQQGAGAAA